MRRCSPVSHGKTKDEEVVEAVEGLPACCKRIAGRLRHADRVTGASQIASYVLIIAGLVLCCVQFWVHVHVPVLSILAIASFISGMASLAVTEEVFKTRRNRLPREEMKAVVKLMEDGWTPKTVSSLVQAHMPWWMRNRAELTLEADRLARRRKIDECVVHDGIDDWPYDGSWAHGEDPHRGLDAERVMRDQGSHSVFVTSLMDVDGWYGETAGSPLPAECRAAAQEAIRFIAQLPRTGADDAQPSEEKMADVEALLDAMTTIGGKPFSEACKAAWDEAKREAEAKRRQAADAGVSEALAKAKTHLEWLASPEASALRDGVSRLDGMASNGLTTGK